MNKYRINLKLKNTYYYRHVFTTIPQFCPSFLVKRLFLPLKINALKIHVDKDSSNRTVGYEMFKPHYVMTFNVATFHVNTFLYRDIPPYDFLCHDISVSTFYVVIYHIMIFYVTCNKKLTILETCCNLIGYFQRIQQL